MAYLRHSLRRWVIPAGLVAVAALWSACANRVMVPPRLDIAPWKQVGLVRFTVENAKGSLDRLATRRFEEKLLDAAPGVEVLELGGPGPGGQENGKERFGAAEARAIGRDRGVSVVFAGHLEVSDVKPSAGINPWYPHVEATVEVRLSVALYSTESGGTLWRASAERRDKVGELGFIAGHPVFSARDPDKAYGKLVRRLVDEVTRDLRPTWRKA